MRNYRTIIGNVVEGSVNRPAPEYAVQLHQFDQHLHHCISVRHVLERIHLGVKPPWHRTCGMVGKPPSSTRTAVRAIVATKVERQQEKEGASEMGEPSLT